MRACALPGAGVSAHLRLPGHLRWRGCSGPRDASTMYGNPWFSVQAGACTEIISFPYTPSDFDPPSSKIGLNLPQIAGIRKRVPFRIARLGR